MTQEIQPIAGMTPKLDYLIQYPVKSILHMDDDEGAATWAVEFENGAIVANEDSGRDAPPEQVVGLALLTTIFSTTDTTLQFGRVDISSGQPVIHDEIQVHLTPTKYTITDPRFEGTHYPQAAQVEPMVPKAGQVSVPVKPSQTDEDVIDVEGEEVQEPKGELEAQQAPQEAADAAKAPKTGSATPKGKKASEDA